MISRISEQSSNKIANLSIICALLVVCIHFGYTGSSALGVWMSGFLQHRLGLIAVPFFFIVSGYFLARHFEEDGWYRQALQKRVITLLLPYLIWNAIQLVLAFIIGGLPSTNILVKYIGVGFGLNPLRYAENAPLWYMRALMLFVLVLPILKLLVEKLRIGIILSLWMLYFVSQVCPGVGETYRFLLKFGFPLDGMTYFCTGLYLVGRERKVSTRMAWSSLVIGLSLTALGYVYESVFPDLAIPFLLTFMWYSVSDKSVPQLLKGASFGIYVMHWPVGWSFTQLTSDVPIFSSHMGMFCCLRWTLAVGIPVMLSWWMHRHASRISRIIFGGR